MSLTREQINKMQDLKIEEIFIEEWNDSVFIRQLNAKELLTLKNNPAHLSENELSMYLIGVSLCDEKGVRLFDDNQINELFDRNTLAVSKIASAVVKLNGLGIDPNEIIKQKKEEINSDPFLNS